MDVLRIPFIITAEETILKATSHRTMNGTGTRPKVATRANLKEETISLSTTTLGIKAKRKPPTSVEMRMMVAGETAAVGEATVEI